MKLGAAQEEASDMHDSRLLLTPEAAAERLSCGRSKVYQLLASGELKSCTLGRCRRIPASELEDFIRRQMEHQADDSELAP